MFAKKNGNVKYGFKLIFYRLKSFFFSKLFYILKVSLTATGIFLPNQFLAK